MTAIARKRKRSTIIGLFATLVLVVAAASMFAVGVVTLSNSEEGEAVGVDLRPVIALPTTPNALLAVTGDAGELESLVVMTLLPDGVGEASWSCPPNADSTAAFGTQRRPLNEVFAADAGDIDAFTSSVEEMLSITIERTQVVAGDDLGTVFGDASTAVPDGPIDDAFWTELAAAAPIDAAVARARRRVRSADRSSHRRRTRDPVAVGRGAIQMLATRGPSEAENPTGSDVVIIDRRDANLVFAQVSPGLVSTPNTGLSVRIVAPFSDDQIEASGDYESTSELVLEVIGEMYFFQANVVSVDTQPAAGGAGDVTLIQVAEERFIEDMEAIAPIVFGESEVVLASTLIEGYRCRDHPRHRLHRDEDRQRRPAR